ncbi:MAG: phenylacetate-CoA oxygenase subunit PaaJ [Geodermatophilaceae bacterium]|nr:phenylacetate-CoA oxygenase subunit PaaJ [Geodermatophilaceae bacterium]
MVTVVRGAQPDVREIAETVTDPELPMLTLADLGVLRDVWVTHAGTVVVSITPTYSGCPAMDAMRDDLRRALRAAGYDDVEVRTVLEPAWTTDWISASGRAKLARAGISPPHTAPTRAPGPIQLDLGATVRGAAGPDLGATVRVIRCPQCGSARTEEQSRFSSTACKSLWRCSSCLEPFEHIKEI